MHCQALLSPMRQEIVFSVRVRRRLRSALKTNTALTLLSLGGKSVDRQGGAHCCISRSWCIPGNFFCGAGTTAIAGAIKVNTAATFVDLRRTWHLRARALVGGATEFATCE